MDARTALRENKVKHYVDDRLPEFMRVLNHHPIKSPKSCICLSEAFWLWTITRDAQPQHVIESGTFEGYSWYFLNAAAPVSAVRACFDPTREPIYGKKHWQKADITDKLMPLPPGQRGLVFFDDHQNHRARVDFAVGAGFEDILLHDNYTQRGASHMPIRFTGLPPEIRECYILPPLDCAPFNKPNQPQNYRWLTWLRR